MENQSRPSNACAGKAKVRAQSRKRRPPKPARKQAGRGLLRLYNLRLSIVKQSQPHHTSRALRVLPLFLLFFLLSLCLFHTPARAGCGDPENGLVGWWKLDDGSGTSAADSSGNGNTGTLNGSPLPTWTTGKINGALTFDGSSQYVTLASAALPSTFSASLWFKTTSDGVLMSEQAYPVGGGPGSHDPFLYVQTTGILESSIYAGTGLTITTSSPVNDGNWHNAVYTVNMSTSVQTFYLDGSSVGSISGGAPEGPFPYIYIGTGDTTGFNNSNNGWFYFNGTIDDVRVYNRALSASEIKNLYNAGYAGDLIFNDDSRVMQYCDGNNWVAMGPVPGTTPTWPKQSKFSSSDQQWVGQFGVSVAASGNIAVVGAHLDAFGGNLRQGGAYVFDISNPAAPVQKAEFTGSDSGSDYYFGISVAVSGNIAVVGAPGTVVGGKDQQGVVYIFDISNPSSPVQKAELTSSDGAANDWFGRNVAVSGNIAVVGAYNKTVGSNANQGVAYVFDISNPSSPVQKAELTSSDGAANDYFGYWVAVSGNIAVVGAYNKTVGGNANQGAAYVFDIANPSSPVQKAEIAASDGAASDYFGQSVAVSGNIAVVGAYNKTVGSNANQGAAYVFDISNPAAPVQKAELTASDGAASDHFGNSVAVSGNIAVVGATNKSAVGAAYVFDIANPSSPVQKAELSAGNSGDSFGNAVALYYGDTALVGAVGADGVGAAYIYGTVCSNPTGGAGDIRYDHDHHVMIYCDGKTWQAMGPVPGAGGSGCSNPADPEDVIIYNADYHAMQYCDGTNWVRIGGTHAAPEGGLVGWWKLDDGSSGTAPTTAADSSGNGNNGTTQGSPTWTSSGKIGNALTFNGSNQYISVPYASSLNISGSWSVSSWVKLASTPGSGNVAKIIGRDDSSANANYYIAADNNALCTSGLAWKVGFDDSGGTGHDVCYYTTITTGTWYFIAGTWDGTTLTLYVNGVSAATGTPGAVPTTNNGGDLELGNEFSNTFYLNGTIDDARVYNRALSASEVWDLYLATGGT